jgi:hypothetical protein
MRDDVCIIPEYHYGVGWDKEKKVQETKITKIQETNNKNRIK